MDGEKAFASAKDCRICGEVTDCSFNVEFKRVRVCESCATQIASQQVVWWAEQQLQNGDSDDE